MDFLNRTINTSYPLPLLNNQNIIYYFVPVYALLFVFGSFGNGLVIISVIRSSRLRTVTNTYLFNIAVADSLLLLSIPFLILTILAKGWIFGAVLCKMYFNFIHINQYVSSLLLAALSIDRYLAVCHPIRAIQFRTKTKCVLIIAACWLISILFICPTWFYAKVNSDRRILWYGYQVQRCVIDFPSLIFTIPPEIVFTYYGLFLGFLIPGSTIIIFYVLVLKRLHKIRRKHQSGRKQRSHRKVTRIVLAVITVYFICWIPYWFLQLFITIDPLIHSLKLNFSILPARSPMRFLKEFSHLTTIIGYANNCLNPLLYVFLSDSFREEYLMVLKCNYLTKLRSACQQNDGIVQQNRARFEKVNKKSRRSFDRPNGSRFRIKHSIAMDELPSLSLKFSNRLSRTSEESQESPAKRVKPKRSGRKKTNQLIEVSLRSPKIVRSEEVSAVSRSLQKSSEVTSRGITFIDDGGVYCGN